MGAPEWEEIEPGLEGVYLPTVDGDVAIVLRSLWESKAMKHANLEGNWGLLRKTLEFSPEVYESRKYPDERKIYIMGFRRIMAEDGSVRPGYLMVVVNRVTRRVVTLFSPDRPAPKLGRRLWPAQ